LVAVAADLPTLTLQRILQSDEYVCIPGVPIFDAHDEFDHDGNLVRRFSKAELQSICDKTNARLATGDLSPFGPGHTIPVVDRANPPKETDQPPPWGFATNLRVSTFGPDGRMGILADFYAKRQVREGDRLVNGIEAIKTYPRRSVELWHKDGYIDWIALLRRTPHRDLGLLTYGKTEAESKPLNDATRPSIFARPGQARPLAACEVNGKLYYAMEYAMPIDPAASISPTAEPDAMAPNQDVEFASKVMRCVNDAYPQLGKIHEEAMSRYAAENGDLEQDPATLGDPNDPAQNAEGAMPSAGNTAIPGMVGDKKTEPDGDEDVPAQFAKPGEPDRFAKLESDLRATAKQAQDLALRYAKAESERLLDRLSFEGFEFDRQAELSVMQKLDEKGRFERAEQVRRYHKQSGVAGIPGGMLPIDPPAGADPGNDFDFANKVKRRATREGISFDEAKRRELQRN